MILEKRIRKNKRPKLFSKSRKSPAEKSYHRNHNKIMEIRIKEERKKLREEFEKKRKQWKHKTRH